MSIYGNPVMLGGSGGGGGGILPTGYTQLEYIESTGTQYIDSGVGNANGLLCVLTGCFVEQQASVDWVTLAGVETETHENHNSFVQKFGNSDYYSSSVNGVVDTNITIQYGTMAQFIVDTRGNNCYMSMGGKRYSRTYSGTVTNLSVCLFALKAGTSISAYAKGRIGSVKFVDPSGIVAGDFYAAKRNSDNALGLYDLITSTFFTNQGTGTFVAGPEKGGVSESVR